MQLRSLVRSMVGIAVLAIIVNAVEVNAAYMVYKCKSKVDEYTENGDNLELERENRLKFDVYVVMDSNYDVSTEKPQRVVVFKLNRRTSGVRNVSPAEYDPSTQSWVTDYAAKEVRKLILSPLSYTWTSPSGEVTTDIEDNYGGTYGDSYIVYGGEWTDINIVGSDGSDKTNLAMVEYYEGTASDSLKGYSEYYAGKLKRGLAKSLKGAVSYYTDDSENDDGIVAVAKRSRMRYDRKFSEKETSVYNAASIEEATEALITLLVEKKHASTWVE